MHILPLKAQYIQLFRQEKRTNTTRILRGIIGGYAVIELPSPAIKKPVKTGLWRERCEDGSQYDLYPENFATADDYEDALKEAKESETLHPFSTESMPPREDSHPQQGNKYRWRNHCEDGFSYGINPEDYETADDYQDAIDEKKRESIQAI